MGEFLDSYLYINEFQTGAVWVLQCQSFKQQQKKFLSYMVWKGINAL